MVGEAIGVHPWGRLPRLMETIAQALNLQVPEAVEFLSIALAAAAMQPEKMSSLPKKTTQAWE